ncbi:hypothetical protein LBMAG57_10100 [Verrucomicrobiota bacterium]|nr:hypothetical protein LBMAG57_10100 [Verrucomicrobiota bacterium]
MACVPWRVECRAARQLRHPETLSPPSPPADGKDLAQELVRNGLARIYGTRTVLWDGRTSKHYNDRLAELEAEAKRRSTCRAKWKNALAEFKRRLETTKAQ